MEKKKKQMHMACTKSNSNYNTHVHLQYADSLSLQTLALELSELITAFSLVNVLNDLWSLCELKQGTMRNH